MRRAAVRLAPWTAVATRFSRPPERKTARRPQLSVTHVIIANCQPDEIMCISGLVAEYIAAVRLALWTAASTRCSWLSGRKTTRRQQFSVSQVVGANCQPDENSCISGLVAEYIVAIDVTRARFPADACGAQCAVLPCGLPLGLL